MITIEQMNAALATFEAARVDQVQHERAHVKKIGLSKHADCMGQQKLVLDFPKPFPAGFAERGIAYHDWWYKAHPVGSFIDLDVEGTKVTLLVYGHEQAVEIFSQTGELVRVSHIDAKLYNYATKQIEYWDLKNNMGGHDDEVDVVYKGQLNLYARIDSKKLGLPYKPTCRIDIASPVTYSEVTFQSWVLDVTLGDKHMADIAVFEAYRDVSFEKIPKKEWAALLEVGMTRTKTGRRYYTKTDGSKGYINNDTWRLSCDRCDNWEKCRDKLGINCASKDKWITDLAIPMLVKDAKVVG